LRRDQGCARHRRNGYEDILRRAEKAAAAFVRDHEREIIAVGDRLYRKGELSGLAIRVLLNRIGALPEDVSQKEGTGVPRPKRKKKKDLQDHDQDQLDASDASQDNDEVEEPDVGEIEDIPQDTYTDLEHATQIQKKKKKKLGRAGRIGDAYYRTDGYISAGGLTVTSNWEPNEQAAKRNAGCSLNIATSMLIHHGTLKAPAWGARSSPAVA
jgi:hypothetical protein